MTEPDRPLLPSSPKNQRQDPPSDGGRRLALGLSAGALLIGVAVVAGVLLVLLGIWVVRLYLSQFQ